MARKLTEREIRVLLIGAIVMIAIPAVVYGTDWLEHWHKVRASLAATERQLQDLRADTARQAGLLSIVPVLELPQPEEEQKFLFRDKLYEQLKKAGIKTEPLQILATRTAKNLPYGVLKIRSSGKCRFDQLLDLLAALPENPYLVGVEELTIQCDTKESPEKRKEIELELTVSTFVR